VVQEEVHLIIFPQMHRSYLLHLGTEVLELCVNCFFPLFGQVEEKIRQEAVKIFIIFSRASYHFSLSIKLSCHHEQALQTSISIHKPYIPPIHNDVLYWSATSSHMRCVHVFSHHGASTASQGPCRRDWEWAPWYPYQGRPSALPLPLRGCQNLVPLWDRAGLLPARLWAHLRQHNWFPQAALPRKQLDSGDFYICRQQYFFLLLLLGTTSPWA
jgi:hypothetical protein